MTKQIISGVLAVLAAGLLGGGMLRLAHRRICTELESEAVDTGPEPVRPGQIILSALYLTALCAAMASWMYFFYGNSLWDIWNAVLLCAVLWACAVSDRKALLIPNTVLLCGTAVKLMLLCIQTFSLPQEASYQWIGSGVTAAALLILALLCRFFSRGSLGLGDVKLLAVMGLFLGAGRIWSCLLICMLCSFFYCVFLLITKRATGKSEIAFAPILLAGTALSYFLTSV